MSLKRALLLSLCLSAILFEGQAFCIPLPIISNSPSQEMNYVSGEVIVKLRPKLMTMGASIFSAKTSDVTINSPAISDLNKKFKVTTIERLIKQRHPNAGVTALSSIPPALSELYILHLPSSIDINKAVSEYMAVSDVIYAQPNYIHKVFATPNDPFLLDKTQWNLIKISAEAAWDICKGTSEVKICILDTGVDYRHPDLAANMWLNTPEDINHDGIFEPWPTTESHGVSPGVFKSGDYDGIDNDGDGWVDDVVGYDFVSAPSFLVDPGEDPAPPDPDPADFFGHGTHCSGIASAATNNGIGVAGLGWNCKIMAVRAGFQYGGGGLLFTSDIVNGLVYAATMKADVISMSFGGGEDKAEKDAIDFAYSKDCVLVGAAGNSNTTGRNYPGGYDNVLSVAATDQNDRKAYFSTYGNWVDVSSPGVWIMSTLIQPLSPTPHTYAAWSGTSMATPLVAGLAGLIRSQHRSWKNSQVMAQIIGTTDDINELNPDYMGLLGSGRINALKALEGTTIRPAATITSPETTNFSLALTGTVEIIGSASGENFSKYSVFYKSGSGDWIRIGPTHEAQVENGVLESFDTLNVNDGTCNIKLAVISTASVEADAYTTFKIGNSFLSAPEEGMLVGGFTQKLIGTIAGYDFVCCSAEWASGLYPNPGDWYNTGIVMENSGLVPVNNGLIASWTPPFSEGDYSLRLRLSFASRQEEKIVHVLKNNLVHRGWPASLDFTLFSSPVCAHLDGSGKRSVVAVTSRTAYIRTNGGDYTSIPRKVHVIKDDGTESPGWPNNFYNWNNYDHSAAVGDINGDGIDEVVVHDQYNLYAYSAGGSIIFTKPLSQYDPVVVLCDVDQDGKAEILTLEDTVFNNSYTQIVHLFDGHGTERPGWPVDTLGCQNMVVGDINNDGSPEVITTGVHLNRIIAIRLDGSYCPGFPVTIPSAHDFECQPMLADVNGDEALEIIALDIPPSLISSNMYVINGRGSVESGYPKVLPALVESRPALGDIDGDGKPELIASNFTYGTAKPKVIAVNIDDGTNVPGFPFYMNTAEEIFFGPAVADLDGDGEMEICAPSQLWLSTLLISQARLHIIGKNGVEKIGWPCALNQKTINSTTQYCVPAIADIDGDGHLELISGNSYDSDRHPLGFYTGGMVTAFNMTGTTSSTIEWQSFQGDNHHTGVYGMKFDPPSLEAVHPATGSTDRPINQQIYAVFNEPIAARIPQNINNFRVYGTKSGAHLCHVTSVPSQNKIIFNQEGYFEPLETVVCTIEGGVHDLYGNALSRNTSFSGSYTFSFSTSDISLGGITLKDINSGSTAYTNNGQVTLEAMDVVGTAEEMIRSEDANFSGATFEPFSNPTTFELSSGDGLKTVYYKVRNADLKESQTEEATITYDSLPPSVSTTEPAAGLYVFPLSPGISATFTDSMLPADATNEAYFSVSGSITGPHAAYPSYEASSDKVIFDQADPFVRGETVSCKVSGSVRDKALNPIGSDHSWSFNIAPVSVESIALFSAATGMRARTRSYSITIEAIGVSGAAEEMMISENPDFSGASWQPFADPAQFTLSSGDGTKEVHYKLRSSGFETGAIPASIVLDTTAPILTEIIPHKWDSNVPSPTSLYLTFNEPMTTEGFRVSISPAVALPPLDQITEGRTFIYHLVPWQTLTTYIVTLESACDLALNQTTSAGEVVYFFTASGSDTNPPQISNIRFDSVIYTDGALISPSPRMTATIVDLGPSHSGVDPLSIHVSIEGYGTFSPDTFEGSSMSLDVTDKLSPKTYLITIEASDLSLPANKASFTCRVKVMGGGAKIAGEPASYPAVFKPLSGNASERTLMITYNLTTAADIDLILYDISGNPVMRRKFKEGSDGGKAGYNTVSWNGVTDLGRYPGNGIYVLKIVSKGKVLGTSKIVVYD